MTLTKALSRELDITLESALMLAEDGTPIPALAERIYDAEPALVAQVQRPFVVERFTWMLYRRQQRAASGNQLPLPGYESLPRRIELKDRKRGALRAAGLQELLQYRQILVVRRDKRLEVLDRLIELMRAYAKPGKTMSVADVMAQEMARLELR
jgi:hypothetical protein